MFKQLYLISFIGLLFPFFAIGQDISKAGSQEKFDSIQNKVQEILAGQRYEEALLILEQNTQFAIDSFGSNSTANAWVLTNKGLSYRGLGNMEKAKTHFVQAIDILQHNAPPDHPLLTYSLRMAVGVFYGLGNYQEALRYQTHLLENVAQLSGRDSDNYLRQANNLGILSRETGAFEKAETLFLEVIATSEKQGLSKGEVCIAAKINLGLLYADLGNFEKGEALFLDLLHFYEKELQDSESPNYLYICTNLGTLYWGNKLYAQAEPFFRKAMDLSLKIAGRESIDYAGALINLGLLLSDMASYEEAEQYLAEGKLLFEETIQNTTHPFYLNCLHNLANVYKSTGKYKQSEELNFKVLSIRDTLLGKSHTDYGKSLENLARLFLEQGKFAEATQYLKAMYPFLQQRIGHAFGFLSEKEREIFIAANVVDYFDLMQSGGLLMEDGAYADWQYDVALLMKGLQLQASKSTLEFVFKQQDSSALRIYQELLEVRSQLAELYETPIADRPDPTTLITRQEDMEKKLARLSSAYRRSKAVEEISHLQIQAALKSGEAAIEFVHFRLNHYLTKDSIIYGALLLLPGNGHARFIPLFGENQLDTLLGKSMERKLDYVDQLYAFEDRGATQLEKKLPGLYALVWEKILPHLQGIEKIYYAPTGLLHRINIGAVPLDDEITIAEKYQLLAMSSTRQLALEGSFKTGFNHEAVLFGGVKYDYDSLAISQGIASLSENSLPVAPGEPTAALATRAARANTWSYLKWTQKESAKVADKFSQNNYPARLLEGYTATEEAFRQFGTVKESPGIIHLATHGYFFPDPAKGGVDKDEASGFQLSEQPMIRSGLLLAGANRVWSGAEPVPGQEDGILTAYEISQMNLTNTELVVLSACETGLGDIKGAEGVFGLQRAFKMAGVRYLIMSLWQVPDFQTQDLMTTFYAKYLEEQMDIPTAFRKAQLEMKMKYQNPYFWAGFVLVE